MESAVTERIAGGELPRQSALIDPSTLNETLAELRTPEGQHNPYPHYARLHAAGTAGVAADRALVVIGYEACAAVLRDHRLVKAPERLLILAGYPDWRDRPSLALMFGSMLMANEPVHTRLRRSVSSAFTARRVAQLRASVETLADDVLDRVSGEVDFVDAVAFPFPIAVIGDLLGVPRADHARFQELVRDWTMVLDFLTADAVDRADAAAAQLTVYLADLADRRRRCASDDLISDLVAQDDALTGAELIGVLALLFAAGFETTTGLLANGLLALLDHPAEAARLRAEPQLDDTAADELLRFDSPVQMLYGRSASTAITIGDLALDAGQRIVTILGAANRDPRVFPDPDRLRLDRVDRPSLSFGGGIHYCLGAPLAKLEASVMFPKLLRAFPGIRLSGPPVHRPGISLHGYTQLPVHV
jgi:cytochrome P450